MSLAPWPATAPGRTSNRALLIAVSAVFLTADLLAALQLRPLAAAPVAFGCVAALAVVLGATRTGDGLLAHPVAWRRLVACVALALALLLLGGETHLFYANTDWLTRDAVLADLVSSPGPPTYMRDGAAYVLRAPTGMYELPALAGRAFGLHAAHVALLVQNAILFGAILYVLASLGRRFRTTLAVLVLFGGLSVLWRGAIWLASRRADLAVSLAVPFDQWHPFLQYSSTVTQLFWVPNHALPGWWIAALLLLARAGEVDAATLGVSVAGLMAWSPLAILPAAPLGLVVFGPKLAAVLRARRTWLGLAAAALFLPLAVYLTLAAGSIDHRSMEGRPDFLMWYVLFIVVQLPAAAFVALNRQAQPRGLGPLVWASLTLLLVLPLFNLGPGNDLVMRGSIAALTILAFAFAEVLGALRAARRPAAWAGAAILAIGALSGAGEVARAVLTPAFPASACNLMQASRQIGSGALPTNYVVEARRAPAWLLSTRAPPRADHIGPCWPGWRAP